MLAYPLWDMRSEQYIAAKNLYSPHNCDGNSKFSGNNKNLCLYHKLGIQSACYPVVKSQPIAAVIHGGRDFAFTLNDLEMIKKHHHLRTLGQAL